MFSRQSHITPESLPEAQVEIDRLLEPLSRGARGALRLPQNIWNGVLGLVNYLLVLRRFVPLAVSLGASVPDSSLHFRAWWRLHKSWVLAVPPEFRTPVDFKLTLAAAVLATVSGEIELGLFFVGMFHCLLRPGEWREVTWKDIHIFENSQTIWYPKCVDEMEDGVWFEPIRAFSRMSCDREWTQEKKNRARHWVVDGAVTQDAMCKYCGGPGTEKHRSYHCKGWKIVRVQLSEEVRVMEEIRRLKGGVRPFWGSGFSFFSIFVFF